MQPSLEGMFGRRRFCLAHRPVGMQQLPRSVCLGQTRETSDGRFWAVGAAASNHVLNYYFPSTNKTSKHMVEGYYRWWPWRMHVGFSDVVAEVIMEETGARAMVVATLSSA